MSSKNNMDVLELDSFLNQSFLDLEKIDENLFRSKTLWKHKIARGVYGGQLIGHSLVAASSGFPEDQHIHSLHSYFLRQGNTKFPMLYYVDKTRDGNTYCACSVKAVQFGQTVYTMQASFKKSEASNISHQITMPTVPPPDKLKTPFEILDILKQQELISSQRHEMGVEWFQDFPMETRWVSPDTIYAFQPEYPKCLIWMKARGHIGKDLHQNVHKCCIAYLCDMLLLRTSLMSLSSTANSVFMASLDHSMWFHAPCHADEWMLFEIEAENTGDGRTLCHGRIWDINGVHITTVSQEGVLRVNSNL
ncbi:acyl-coenzyme A thioesterase 8 [Biomphalaria glabrata]|uniref:Acyl-coenzyme A thioesterase 8-like n=1 Tax=Biomphalaria glabrata TaxID=6526 RepID=A0A9W3ATW7_BIOGL|nr:acyl-coenzyme A thioesterase 8-like [Biomphalaria glabrata]XP_013062603.2 acyl-coenzyme A thioesterase 8-like [Biomphalaria glabrata]XP_013062604.2 acyl-coenzyme A thioesterase 8-like [Biomphalaria glabrata]XP_013062605.2 acyl-coenzyme A thioesterase 8-like [Biomphalaria glabrata]XP_013062606.2 acyl-coenzyme A thioesterase 8-like [Biomphalaria glabrata]XP_013062608.2 acyl-coenzyme A thioesterase 8-like [Biomphalaria glabrata]XP_055890670.1 acyl-coenzyme A thioesterase 8-like [Biomphalaria 